MICKVKSHNEIWLQKQKMENELYYFHSFSPMLIIRVLEHQ